MNIGSELLPAIAYGDATGLPYEAKKSSDIPKVTGLNEIVDNPYLGKHPKGTWSDDTHLSIAVALAQIKSRGFNLGMQAQMHVDALRHVGGEVDNPDMIPPILTDSAHSGWGGSTTRSVEKLSQGISPVESGEPNGAGNGVLMKMAPLLYWQYVRGIPLTDRLEQITQFTRMTHASLDAVVSSFVHDKVMNRLFLTHDAQDIDINGAFIKWVADIAEQYEQHLHAQNILSTKLRQIGRACINGVVPVDVIYEVTPKKGFYAPETLAIAYGNFANNTTFPESIYSVVELGGDTDSTASITATMSLFLHGSITRPEDYTETFDFERLQRISHSLALAAITN